MTDTRSMFAPLAGFSSPGDIELGNDARVIRAANHHRQMYDGALNTSRNLVPIAFGFCVIIHGITTENDADKIREAIERVEEVVLRIRIQKPGQVGFNTVIMCSSSIAEAPPAEGVLETLGFAHLHHFTPLAMPPFETACRFEQSDIDDLRTLWGTTIERRLVKELPFRSFSQAYNEPYLEDRFLKNAIGLESILVAEDDQSNVAYKFKMRGARLLGRETESRFASIYRNRSKLVHGSQSRVEPDVALDAEDFLRRLLKLRIFDPTATEVRRIDDRMLS